MAAVAAARLPAIDTRRCTGCGRCVGACAPGLLSLEPQRWVKHAVLQGPERCTGCAACAVVCPFRAIQMQRVVPMMPVGPVVAVAADPGLQAPDGGLPRLSPA